jgi:hypothetical protein
MMLSSGEDAGIPVCLQVASNGFLRIERLASVQQRFDGGRGPFAALSRTSQRTVVKARRSPCYVDLYERIIFGALGRRAMVGKCVVLLPFTFSHLIQPRFIQIAL